MYSGSDSTESQKYPQWALNPSTYQNMSNEQVDWAALAQQWIIMKEAGPPPVCPADPKPKPKKEPPNEGGEAPMDVENEKEDNGPEWNNVSQPANNWNWNSQNQNWGWSNTWTPPTGVPPPVPLKPPLLPTPSNFSQFNAPPESTNDNANFPGYNTAPNSEFGSGYWTSASGSKQIKPHNRRFSKVNVPRPVQPVVAETPPTLDANKRKQLPAWIREGLEKMERDKQKQVEREKEKQERDEYNEKLKQSEKETMEILKSTIKEQQQQKSKFESDGEYSDDGNDKKRTVYQPEPVVLTPAEQMINVRRTMTEILLLVTGREIEMICREELQRHHKKQKASDRRVSAPSGANVTAKLGLGIYGGESGTSSSDDSEGENGEQKDSDAELKDSIKRKKAEFSKTEREIEDKLAEAESRKQENASRSPTPHTNDNDTQVDAKVQDEASIFSSFVPSRKKERNVPPERTILGVPGSRKRRSLSDSKSSLKRPKSKSRSSSSSSEATSSYTDSRKRNSGHRSSTSSSGGRDSKKVSKRGRSRSISRSRTPDKSRRKDPKSKSKRSRSRSGSKQRKARYSRRSRSRSRSRSRTKSPSYRRRRSRSRSPYSKRRRSRSRSRSRRRRSRSSSSGRGKRSRRR